MDIFIHLIESETLLTVSSLLFGLSVLIGVTVILSMAKLDTGKTEEETYNYTNMRQQELRKADSLFRFTERFVLELTPYCLHSAKTKIIRKAIPHMKTRLPWLPEEYLAFLYVQGLFVGVGLGIFFWCAVHPIAGIVVGFFIGHSFVELLAKSLMDEAKNRRSKIVSLLPFAVDLMSLTRGAGATFPESIEVVATECSGTPLGDEFMEVLQQTVHGRTEKQVFDDLAERVGDQDFHELAFMLNKANELGTPVTEALTELSEQMRLKRQQRGEKASGEAQVKIMFPGTIIMIACIIVIIAPFILQAIYVGL
jgi:Flp pilus assembly protein TadB